MLVYQLAMNMIVMLFPRKSMKILSSIYLNYLFICLGLDI